MSKKIKTPDQLYKNQLDYDNLFNRNMKISNEIVNEDYYVQYGINKRKQLGVDIFRAKETVDLKSLIPGDAKVVFFTTCKGDTMPKLNDNVEVIVFDNNNFTKFPYPLPKNLKELYLTDNIMKKLPDLSHLKKLWCLYIYGTKINFLPKNLPDNIEFLSIDGETIKSTLKNLPLNLIVLVISRMDINKIPDLSYLSRLKMLRVINPNKKKQFEIDEGTRKMNIIID
jgi:Leucine-rich repeat (LRR) protein